jgi:hypothetical protein
MIGFLEGNSSGASFDEPQPSLGGEYMLQAKPVERKARPEMLQFSSKQGPAYNGST